MERTLEIMMEELRLAKKEREPLSKAIYVVKEKIRNLENEIEKYKLDNGLYHPMSDLNKYIGKEISSITLVEKNKEGSLVTKHIYNDEILEVDKDGHLYYSSYDCGILRYDEKINKYVKWFHCSKIEHDFVGFLEIELQD